MKVIKWILTFLGGALLFTVLSVIAVYLTLDISTLSPSLEQLIQHHSGASAKLSGLRWSSFDTISFDQVKLTWPLSAEEQAEWDSYRSAKRAKKSDESVTVPSRPLPAMSVCATDVSAQVDLFKLAQDESATVVLDGLVLSCLDSPGSLKEGASRRLQAKVSARHKNGILGRMPKTGFELKAKGELSEVPTQDIKPLLDRLLPVKLSGAMSARFNLTLPMTRRGTLQQRKGDGEVLLEVSALKNDEGMIGMLELPKMSLGDIKADLKLKQGTVHFNEFTIRSSDLTGEVTGSVGIRSSLSRFSVKSHISLELSPEFVKNTPDIKKIAMLQRKFFKPRGAGYHVGVDLRGPASRLRSSAREYSPYSKEGRAQQRERRTGARPATRAKAKRANRPRPKPRSAKPRSTRRPSRRPASASKGRRKGLAGAGGRKGGGRRGAKGRDPAPPFGPINTDSNDEEPPPNGGELGEEEGEGEELPIEEGELGGEELDEKVAGEESEEGD